MGLQVAQAFYAKAYTHLDDLCAPYASVIDIQAKRLPSVEMVQGWTGDQFVQALRHNPSDPEFNPDLRQLLHVGYKIAAQMGEGYLHMLESCKESIARNVTENLYQRHLKPLTEPNS
jgi:hypothetical protein